MSTKPDVLMPPFMLKRWEKAVEVAKDFNDNGINVVISPSWFSSTNYELIFLATLEEAEQIKILLRNLRGLNERR